MGILGGLAKGSVSESTSNIITSTGGIDRSYQVLDTIFAIDSNKEGFFSGADPNKSFAGVKRQLINQCAHLGGDAVIFCQFEYRIALNGNKQVVEIFAYGTVVKFLN